MGLLTAYLSVYISPGAFWPVPFFGLGYPFMLAVNIFFILLWLLIRPRFFWFSLVALLLGWGFFTRIVQIKGRSVSEADIKVLSYNVNHFNGNGRNRQKETARKIAGFLKKERPDIICLQEVRLRKNHIFNLVQTIDTLDFIHHYQYARSSTTFGSVTMTRYPIIHMDEIRFENSRNISIFTDVLIGEDTVRIFNVHLHSYGLNPGDYSIIDSGMVSIEKDLQEARKMGSKLKTGFQVRARQADIISDHVRTSPYPVILCGDLNDTPVSYSYQQVRKGLKDAFVSSGRGVGRTYIGKLPSFRIDYIFHSNDFDAWNFHTHSFRQSDHLPISCGLIRRKNF